MTKEEFDNYIATKKDGKDFIWNNYFEQVDPKLEYRGEYSKEVKGLWEGIGQIKFKDGSLYSGFIKNKQFNGKGRLVHANNNVYQGEWKDGKANGYGVFFDKSNTDQGISLYEGQFLNDQ